MPPSRQGIVMARLPKSLKFEDAMQRLEQIVHSLESGEIGIEDAIEQYEQAVRLAAHCRRILDDAERRIRKIQVDAAGQLRSEPFEEPDDEPTAESS